MRYFTPEQATRTLPLVRQIAEDLRGLHLEIGSRGDRIESLAATDHFGNFSAHAEELADMRLSLKAERLRVDEMMAELQRVGAEVDSVSEGSIDFPAVMAGREIRLCWKPGDARVDYWHEVDEPSSHRRRIDGSALFAVSQS
jgi:hypothetical protein